MLVSWVGLPDIAGPPEWLVIAISKPIEARESNALLARRTKTSPQTKNGPLGGADRSLQKGDLKGGVGHLFVLFTKYQLLRSSSCFLSSSLNVSSCFFRSSLKLNRSVLTSSH